MFKKMCDNFEELSETYFRFSVALVEAEFGFLTKLNDSTTMKGKCYGSILRFLLEKLNCGFSLMIYNNNISLYKITMCIYAVIVLSVFLISIFVVLK